MTTLAIRALIDEVNVWVLPDLNEELSGRPDAGGPPPRAKRRWKAASKRAATTCCLIARSHRAATTTTVRRWISHICRPTNLIYHAERAAPEPTGSRPTACSHAGTMPAATSVAKSRPDWSPVTLTYYRDHVEHRTIGQDHGARCWRPHQASTLVIQEVDYDEWHRGDVVSDIWLNSANFTLPLDFSLFVSPL